MADETVPTVTVKALEVHSYHGTTYQVGETYDIEATHADSVELQGKAVRVERAAAPPADAKPADSTRVPPHSTRDFHTPTT